MKNEDAEYYNSFDKVKWDVNNYVVNKKVTELLTCFSLHFIDFLMILMELLYRNFNTFLSLSKTANFGKDKSCGERTCVCHPEGLLMRLQPGTSVLKIIISTLET